MLRDVTPQGDHSDLSERFSDFVNFIMENFDTIAPEALPNLQFGDEFDFPDSPLPVPQASPASSSASSISSVASEATILNETVQIVDHEVVNEQSDTAAPQYTPLANAAVISEAEEIDLHAEVMCTFSAYLGYDYHYTTLGDLLGHLAICPLGRIRTFCTHCFKHGPVYVMSSHELVCSQNARPAYFPSSNAETSDF